MEARVKATVILAGLLLALTLIGCEKIADAPSQTLTPYKPPTEGLFAEAGVAGFLGSDYGDLWGKLTTGFNGLMDGFDEIVPHGKTEEYRPKWDQAIADARAWCEFQMRDGVVPAPAPIPVPPKLDGLESKYYRFTVLHYYFQPFARQFSQAGGDAFLATKWRELGLDRKCKLPGYSKYTMQDYDQEAKARAIRLSRDVQALLILRGMLSQNSLRAVVERYLVAAGNGAEETNLLDACETLVFPLLADRAVPLLKDVDTSRFPDPLPRGRAYKVLSMMLPRNLAILHSSEGYYPPMPHRFDEIVDLLISTMEDTSLDVRLNRLCVTRLGRVTDPRMVAKLEPLFSSSDTQILKFALETLIQAQRNRMPWVGRLHKYGENLAQHADPQVRAVAQSFMHPEQAQNQPSPVIIPQREGQSPSG